MEVNLEDLRLSPGLCRCCYNYCTTKNLWLEYLWMGKTEVYAEMIQDCFNLKPWSNSDDAAKDRICEKCISQLRVAVEFKEAVLQAQQKFVLGVKVDMEDTSGVSQVRLGDEDYNDNNFNDEYEPINDCEDYGSCPSDTNEITPDTTNMTSMPTRRQLRTHTLRKPPGKLKGTYAQVKTRSPSSPVISTNKGNHCLLLECSSIIPFKSKSGFFNCFLCRKPFVLYEDLKAHYLEEHRSISYLEYANDPLFYWPKERLFADVSEIQCKLCKEEIGSVRELVTHLTEFHNKCFNHNLDVKPENCVLGYDLSDGKLRCAICKKDFHYFKILALHMNEHDSDFVCHVCGKGFVLYNRLRYHQRRHVEKQRVCKLCSQVFPSEYLYDRHREQKHRKTVYSCMSCKLEFSNERLRTLHLNKVHGRPIPKFECVRCHKVTKTKEGLRLHKKNSHCG